MRVSWSPTGEQGGSVNVSEDKAQAAPKKKKNKLAIVGVIVVIVAALGVGMWVWHEQPSFCNAICHTPMDPYLPTYEATPGQAATDKWGNEVKDAHAMLAATHRADENITCMGCHVPTLGEQVSEAGKWITGNYTVKDNATFGVVLEERDLGQLTEARAIPKDEFCLNAACHDLERADLKQKTADRAINPHDDHHGKQDCSDCHKAHRASVLQCAKCHNDAVLPAGWLTPAQADKLA